MTNLSTLDYVENFTISKSLNDRMWQLNFTLDKDDAPEPMIGIRAFATDHNDVEHCLFIGFIPGAEHIRKTANNKVSITAYDFSWYLSAQYTTRNNWNVNVQPETVFHHVYLLAIGENDYETGLELDQIGDIETTCPYAGRLNWGPQTSKEQALEDMCQICEKYFWVHIKETSSDVFVPCIYFISPTTLDTHLPSMVTFTSGVASGDDYVIDVKINENRAEKYNRVNVYGTNPETGDWYRATEETAAVTAKEEKPIEYNFESAKLDSQAKTDAKALDLYTTLQTEEPKTYFATLKKRYDLELLQKVKFIGYGDIDEIDMRIISISYQRQLNDDVVSISFTKDQSFISLESTAKFVEEDVIETQEHVIKKEIDRLTHIEPGTVTAISGNIATVELERSGNTIEARILD